MQKTILVTNPQEVIDPATLGVGHFLLGTTPYRYKESKFVGFQCLACGERHLDLGELMDCQEDKRRAPVVNMAVFPVAV